MTRVYEIAKEVGIPNKDLIAKIRALGLEVNNHMSSLDADDVVRIKRSLEKDKSTVATPPSTQKLSGTVVRRRSAGDKGDEPEAPAKPERSSTASAAAQAPLVRRRTTAEDAPPASDTPRAESPVAARGSGATPTSTPPVVRRAVEPASVSPSEPAAVEPPRRQSSPAIAAEAPRRQSSPAIAAAAAPAEAPRRQSSPVIVADEPRATAVAEAPRTEPTRPAVAAEAPTPAAAPPERRSSPKLAAEAPRPAAVEAPAPRPPVAPVAAPARPESAAPSSAVAPSAKAASNAATTAGAAGTSAASPTAESRGPGREPVAARPSNNGSSPAPRADDAPAERPRSRVIVAGPQVVGNSGAGSSPREQGVREAAHVQPRPPQHRGGDRDRDREPEPPPSSQLPPRAPAGTAVTAPRPSTRSIEVVMSPRGQGQSSTPRSSFEIELERARARTADRPIVDTPKVDHSAAPAPAPDADAPARDPLRPAVGSIIALPPRIKITERTPMGATGRPAPGPAPANPIRGRFAQQQQRGGPRGPGGRPGMGNDFGRKKLPLGKKGKQTTLTTPAEHKRVIRIEDTITVSDLSRGMGVKAPEVLKKLWGMGMTGVNINASIDFDTAQLLAGEFAYEVQNVAFKEDDIFLQKSTEDAEVVVRSPVVTVMGHVDHGKTSLLDAIRKTRVAAGESGGITQHVAAYKVKAPGHGDIVFLDTPGHEAFTEMRARGAQATDIVILVVAANDGVMPQTLEALAHAKDAKVQIIVAVNKCDLPDAQPDRIRQQLADKGLIPEEWGGETIYVNVSALRGENIDKLLEQIAVTAEVLELRASPTKPAQGTVIEARLDRNRGPMATILVQEGTLRAGDIVVVGRTYGKVRAMLDDRGNSIDEAGPSTPIELLGLDGVPEAGDMMNVAEDDKVAKQVVENRRQSHRKRVLASTTRISLEGMMERNSAGAIKELKIVLKADVQGSAEALKASLTKQSTEKVRVVVIAAGVGGITESDVNLAKAGGAIIVGFHVRPAGKSAKLAEQEEVEIRLYDIIYDALDEVKAAMAGLLAPIKREVPLGKASVRDTFAVPKIGVVAGCMITDGKITRKAYLRLIRDAVQVYEGRVGSLRRFKDDVSEVGNGFECGIMIAGYNDVKVGDVIEAFEIVEEAAKL